MKFTIVLFSFVVAVSAIKQETFQIPENKLVIMRKASDQCALEYNVDPGVFSRIADGTLPRDEATNKYLHCFARKIGAVDESGHFIVEKMSYILGDHPRLAEFKEAVIKCNDITEADPIATTVAMNRCFCETVPVLYIF